MSSPIRTRLSSTAESNHGRPAWRLGPGDTSTPLTLAGPMAYLGAAVCLLISAESAGAPRHPGEGARRLGPLSALHPYLAHRWGLGSADALP